MFKPAKPKKVKKPPIRTKDSHPNLGNRLPRERGGLIAAIGDGMTLFDRALMILGDRVKNMRVYYTLDGKACNATDLMKAAGITVPD